MNRIEFGDCRDIMKRWADEGVKVQTCVTSPPYFGLRDYGHDGQIGLEETVDEYVAAIVDVFKRVKDLLADDGTLWLNLGDSYYNYRPGKGQSLVKQTVSNTDQDLPQNCARRGNKQAGLKEKDLIGIPWRVAFALQADGWYLRQDIIWHKPNPMPESVRDRCTKNHEYIFLLTKNSKYYFDNEAIKEPVKEDWGTRDRSDGKYHNEGSGLTPHSGLEKSYDMANKRSVWTVTTKPFKGAHFAVYPPELIEPCIMSGSKVGDIVLDPFMGSGTTAAVSQRLNRAYLGCELNKDYETLQKERLKQPSLELL
jgi:DNA modification methylase